MKATQLLHNLGQSLWLDNITRDLLDNGTLQQYVDELSVTGLTSNPTIFDQAIKGSGAYDASIRAGLSKGKAGEELFFDLALDDITRAADLFRPIYDRTNTVDGWVSLEVSPLLAHDTASTLAAAKRIVPPSAAPSRPVNFGLGDLVLIVTCLYSVVWWRASVAVFPLVHLARSEAWPERLRPCHWRLAMLGFPGVVLIPLGRLPNVPDTPLGSRRLVVSPPASTSCRHRTTGLWLRTTLGKQLLGHPIAMPGVWGRFTLQRVLPREEFMGRGQVDTELRRGPTACASCSLYAAWACV
jgi:transaldolase/fructose-6-phosphate aldolase-like protein